jgi:hypothetical protein
MWKAGTYPDQLQRFRLQLLRLRAVQSALVRVHLGDQGVVVGDAVELYPAALRHTVLAGRSCVLKFPTPGREIAGSAAARRLPPHQAPDARPSPRRCAAPAFRRSSLTREAGARVRTSGSSACSWFAIYLVQVRVSCDGFLDYPSRSRARPRWQPGWARGRGWRRLLPPPPGGRRSGRRDIPGPCAVKPLTSDGPLACRLIRPGVPGGGGVLCLHPGWHRVRPRRLTGKGRRAEDLSGRARRSGRAGPQGRRCDAARRCSAALAGEGGRIKLPGPRRTALPKAGRSGGLAARP